MSDALEGQPQSAPTLREQANAPRIGRARFIGNAIGALLVVAVLAGIYTAAGIALGGNAALYSRFVMQAGGNPLTVPSPGAALILGTLYLVILVELAVRRRHDRGRSGVDVIVWAELALGNFALQLFAPPGIERLAVGGVTALVGIILLVVLAILPGTKGPNAYGPPPSTH